MALFLPVTAVVAGTFSALIALHVMVMAAGRLLPGPFSRFLSFAGFWAVVLAGPVLVCRALSLTPGGEAAVLRPSALVLYGAFCIGYVELRSLLFRSVSLRILVDLLQKEDGARLRDLRESYSGGMGMSGLLDKRLRGLVSLGLLRRGADTVGPLTPAGRAAAAAGRAVRRLLRLEAAG